MKNDFLIGWDQNTETIKTNLVNFLIKSDIIYWSMDYFQILLFKKIFF